MYELLLRAADWWVGTAVGGGLVLLAGCVLMLAARQPAVRQRLGEVAVFAALLVAGLRLFPSWLPPVFPSIDFAGEAVAATSRAAPVRVDVADLPPVATAPETEIYLISDVAAVPSIDPTPEPLPPPAWTWRDLAAAGVSAYLLVAAALAGRWLLGQWALRRMLRQARPAAPRVRRLFTAMALDILPPVTDRGLSVLLRLSRRLRAPVCFGLRRPAVLLPEPMEDADDAELRWVFAHELTHLRRRDPWSSWGFGLAQAVYFYLPWFWWARRQVRLCQEYVADAAAAGAGPAADEYAEFLVSLARRRAVPLGATGLGSSSDLLRRVQMLLQPSTRVSGHGPRGRSLLAAGGLLAVAVFAGGVGLRAEAPDDEKKSEEKKEIVIVRPKGGEPKTFTVHGGAIHLSDDNTPHHVTVRVVADEDKDDEKGDKKGEKKTEVKKQMRIIVDTGDGPIVVPFDGKGDIGEKVQEAVRKAKAKAEKDAAGDKEQDKATQKALELLKGELDEAQIRQLKKHLEEIRARHRAEADRARADGDKARAEGDKARAQGEKARADMEKAHKELEKAQEVLKFQGVDAEQLQKHIEKAMQQGMAGAHDGQFKAFAGPQAFTFAATGGRLGVQLKKPSSDLADQLDLPKDQGLVIVEIQKGSAAAKAGLKTNDILLEVDGKPVNSDVGGLIKRIQEVKPDEEIAVIVLRKGHKEKVGGIKLPEAKKGEGMLWKQSGDGGVTIPNLKWSYTPSDVKKEDGEKKEHRIIEVHPEIRVLPEGGKTIRVRPIIKDGKSDKDEVKSEKGQKSEKKVNRTVSVTINNGKLTAEQKEDDVTITVTGTVDGGKVDVDSVVVKDDGSKKSYKRVGDVPETYRESVKRLISNTRDAPMQFEFKRSEKKSDE